MQTTTQQYYFVPPQRVNWNGKETFLFPPREIDLNDNSHCYVRQLRGEQDVEYAYDLHNSVLQYCDQTFMYPKTMEQLNNLINGDNFSFGMFEKRALSLIGKLCIITNPAPDDMIYAGDVPNSIVLGGMSTSINWRGRGVIQKLMQYAIESTTKYEYDVLHPSRIVAISTHCNPGSWVSLMHCGFKIIGGGYDASDGSNVYSLELPIETAELNIKPAREIVELPIETVASDFKTTMTYINNGFQGTAIKNHKVIFTR
jgi:hypothetical protein